MSPVRPTLDHEVKQVGLPTSPCARLDAGRTDSNTSYLAKKGQINVVHKLLHTPPVQVKRLAGGPDGTSYARALCELFELDPQIPATVAVVRRGDVLSARLRTVGGRSSVARGGPAGPAMAPPCAASPGSRSRGLFCLALPSRWV